MYESFVAQWLLDVISPYLDPNQCGLKGSSVTHYLIKLLHFIHSTLDLRSPHAVLAICIDLSKAFNRVDHILVIQDLFDMHTPPWLLNIVFSYLTNRTMTIRFRGAQSSLHNLPAGSPQGAFLGGLIFMIKFNGAMLRPSIPRPLPLQNVQSLSVKFVDDGTFAAAVNLRSHLRPDHQSRPHPRTFHERTGHFLPSELNLLQHQVKDTEKFVCENNMVINKKEDMPDEIFFHTNT